MKVVRSFAELPETLRYPILTIGSYDGVHRGHQEIIHTVVRRARERAGTGIVVTFDPHPQKVISPQDAPPLLQTEKQKLECLRSLGVDFVVVLPFTRELSQMEPRGFIQSVILDNIRAGEIRVGHNFRFGRGRSGNVAQLRQLGFQMGFLVYEVPEMHFRALKISSTNIRRSIAAGRAALAGRLLGRAYGVEGTVVRGSGLGAPLGFPTANIQSENELLPADGVYIGTLRVGGRSLRCVVNIGRRPTLHGESAPRAVEAHALDYAADLYGQFVAVDFCARLRSERRFESSDALIAQIRRDIIRARKVRFVDEPQRAQITP